MRPREQRQNRSRKKAREPRTENRDQFSTLTPEFEASVVSFAERRCTSSQTECARLFDADARWSACAGAWDFGLCATRSREPRQARKGATVPGMPRVPQKSLA